MEIKAQLNHLHISPRKVRLVADVIRGMEVKRAEIELQHIMKRASSPLLKLLRSAISNAKHDFQLSEEDLYVKKILVNPGPVLKRFRARAFGRAAPVRRRTSHLLIELGISAKGGESKRRKSKKTEPVVREVTSEDIRDEGKTGRLERSRDDSLKARRSPGFVRRMFRRKAI